MIFYLNHATGDDADDGSSWALAWKTISLGATAARTAPGDVIRIAKTPDPTLLGNADWTNLSKTVTLAAAANANIDMCATVWTAVANVTTATTATRKEGSLACQITVGATFVDGKMAYKTIDSTDFSAYQQISFWMRSSVATSALKICLCSDTAGATIVDEFTLPALSTVNQWYQITINKGANLGAAIQSVALYAIVDPGVPVIIIDDIIACKAVASAGSLSLKSLISKNSLATGGTHSWHGIQSINGATVMLDNANTTLADAGRGYSGATETVATYKREVVTITAVETINESGTEGSPIDYQCGFNTVTNVQDGETFLDGQIGTFNGLFMSSKNFVKVSNLSFIRCAVGAYISTCYYLTLVFGSLCNNTSYGLQNLSACNNITVRDICNNTGYGFHNTGKANIVDIINVNSNLSHGFYWTSTSGNQTRCTNIKNNATYGLQLNSCSNEKFIIATADNETAGIWSNTGLNYLNKSTIAEAIEVTGLTAYGEGAIFSTLHDNNPMSHKVFMDGGIIQSQSAVRQTVSGVAWKISPTSLNRNSYYPVILPIARIAVDSGSAITVNAWFLRDNVDITGKLVCRKGQLSGLTTDQIATITAGIDTWQELSITFTPTESGVVEIEAWAYGGTTYSVYVDSIRIS